MQKLFKEIKKTKEQKSKKLEQYYKEIGLIDRKLTELENKIKKIKLEQLGVNIGDKVIDAKSNKAFLAGVNFRQKPITFLEELKELTLDDFEFRGVYKKILKDGSCGKKEDCFLDFETLKRYKN